MKTVCVYHSIDLDGWMSAAIIKYYWNNMPEMKSVDDTINFIGFNYGNPIPDLSEYDKIIMCDISFPKEEMSKLWHNLDKNLIWIDHHISSMTDNNDLVYDGIRDVKYAACELTWKYFFPTTEMPEIVRLLGRYDCFGHKGTDEEIKVLEFQYGARECITNYEDAYNNLIQCVRGNESEYWRLQAQVIVSQILEQGKFIYQYLCTDAKQVYKNGFTIKLIEEITDNIGKNIVNRKFVCINKERFNPINFGINYHKDGYDGACCFNYDGKLWTVSLYNDNGLVDCSIIAKQFGGGGHKGASGFRLNNIDNFLIYKV